MEKTRDETLQIVSEKERLVQVVEDFHTDIDRLQWPKVLYVKNGKTFWDLVVALRVDVDWHFEETDEGFAFFLIGPTMVRVDNHGQPVMRRLTSFRDGFATAAKAMMIEGGPVDAGDSSKKAA